MTEVRLLYEILAEYLNAPRDTTSNPNRHRRGTGDPSAPDDAREDFCAYIGHFLDDLRVSPDKLNIRGGIAERLVEFAFPRDDILALPGEPEEVSEESARSAQRFRLVWVRCHQRVCVYGLHRPDGGCTWWFGVDAFGGSQLRGPTPRAWARARGHSRARRRDHVRPRHEGGMHAVRTPRRWASLDEGPPAQGRRHYGPAPRTRGRACLDEGPPTQGRRPGWPTAAPQSGPPGLDEGPPAQGRRPASTRPRWPRRWASLDEGPPAQGRQQGAYSTLLTWPFGSWPRSLPGSANHFASQPGLASWACHLPVVSCAKVVWFRRADGGFAASFIGAAVPGP
jgi:hypothetical protein